MSEYVNKNPTFCRLFDGSWGIQTANPDLKPDDKLDVVKRSGERVTVVVGAEVSRRTIDGVVLIQRRVAKTLDDKPKRPVVQRAGKCDNCDAYAKALSPRSDSSGIPGNVCPMCAGLAKYELSFA